jgi:glycine cleavage system T protein
MDISSGRRLPLEDLHPACGAAWTVEDGWRLPAHYGDSVAEHQAVRSGAGLIDSSARVLLRVVGSDRAEFLHGLTTNHIKALRPGQGCYSAMLNAKGKVVGELTVLAFADHLLLDMPSACERAVKEQLEFFRFREEVEFSDISKELATLGLHGPQAPKLIEKASSFPVQDLPDYHFRRGSLAGLPVVVARVNRTGEEGFEVYTSLDDAPALWEHLLELGARAFGQEALETLRIEAAIARFGREIVETVTPWEAGMEHAIHLNKGCYVGQEVIARMENLGRIPRKIEALVLQGREVPRPGSPVLRDGQVLGKVTSACFGPTVGRPVALARLAREGLGAGEVLAIEVEKKLVEATLREPPLAGSLAPPRGAII